MKGAVFINSYDEPPFRMDEILRYAGAGGTGQEDVLLLAKECADMVRGKLSYQVCWREFPVRFEGSVTDMGFIRSESLSLRRCLAGCERAILFAATVGIEMDRLIAHFSAVSPVRALLLQAVGAERIEALCDRFCGDISGEAVAHGERIRPRFSPGYGDLPIEVQRDIFRVLDCPANIGLTLNESLLMSPSKSVTAIIGVRKKSCGADDDPDESAGCGVCPDSDCPFRKNQIHEDQ